MVGKFIGNKRMHMMYIIPTLHLLKFLTFVPFSCSFRFKQIINKYIFTITIPKRKLSNDYVHSFEIHYKISLVCRFWYFSVNFHTCTSFSWDKENSKFLLILGIWSIALQKKKTTQKSFSELSQ